MNTPHFKVLVPGLVGATALVLAVSAGAQTPAPAAPPATKSAPAVPMTGHGHHKGNTAKDMHHADKMKECAAMMAKHQEMQGKLQAMDVTLDKLVAEMNAARESKTAGAMEGPMAAVINELVAQRKASRSMMMEAQQGSMAHMSHHMQMHGTKGAMECPMMKKGDASGAKAEEQKPKM